MTNPELIISISAVVISLLAFIYAAIDSYHNKRHNKLSVRPIITHKTTLSGGANTLKVQIENHGTGPAIIETFAIFVDGKQVDHNDGHLGLMNALSILEINGSWVHFTPPATTLSPGEKFMLIWHKKENSSWERFVSFKKALNRLTFRIGYSSIYEEKFTHDTPPLRLKGIELTGVPLTWPKEPQIKEN